MPWHAPPLPRRVALQGWDEVIPTPHKPLWSGTRTARPTARLRKLETLAARAQHDHISGSNTRRGRRRLTPSRRTVCKSSPKRQGGGEVSGGVPRKRCERMRSSLSCLSAHLVGHERLPAKTWLDRHDEHKIELLAVREDLLLFVGANTARRTSRHPRQREVKRGGEQSKSRRGRGRVEIFSLRKEGSHPENTPE